MASGILGSAISGLTAFQRSLDTTSHNIANVTTEGYSRQRVELSTRPAQFTGAGFLGQGVNIEDITRSFDSFIINQLRSSTSAFADVNQYSLLAAQVDNIIADTTTSMAPALSDFFNAVNELADDPSSIPARQVVLSAAEILMQRFHTMNARFEEIRDQVNVELRTITNEINSLSSAIADMNNQIIAAQGQTGTGQLPNDLLDQRDVLLKELAEKIDVTVINQENGAVNVFIGKGQALVMETTALQLTTVASDLDPDQLEIAFVTSSGTQIITRDLTGGELAGTLRFRDEILTPAQQQLGLVAAGLAMEFNAIHESGFDLNGDAGEAFFTFANGDMPVLHAASNTGDAVVTASFETATEATGSKLDFSDFQLNFSGGTYTLTRLRDNQVINLDAVETPPASGIFDLQFSAVQPPSLDITELPGITITVDLSGGNAIADGDDFLIRPAYSAAEKIITNISDPEKIAAATNVEVDPVTGEPVLDGMGNPVIINGPLPGDNRNALRLADLQNKQGLLGGTASFQDTYGQIVANVGTLTRAAQVSSAAQETLLNQAINARESVSGVNLDEEAANLIKFQQAYQAAAQVIAVTSVLFDTLIGAVRGGRR